MRKKIWKYATLFIVMFLILNPELLELALFINTIGLDLYLILFEVQILAILSTILSIKINPFITSVKSISIHQKLNDSFIKVKKEAEIILLHTSIPAMFMHMLVLSAAISIVLNR